MLYMLSAADFDFHAFFCTMVATTNYVSFAFINIYSGQPPNNTMWRQSQRPCTSNTNTKDLPVC